MGVGIIAKAQYLTRKTPDNPHNLAAMLAVVRLMS